jgi:hypothetical protein
VVKVHPPPAGPGGLHLARDKLLELVLLVTDLDSIALNLVPNQVEEAFLLQFRKAVLNNSLGCVPLLLAELELLLRFVKDLVIIDEICCA